VRGHRVPYEPEVVEEEHSSSLLGVSMHTNYLFWVLAGIGVTVLFILILYWNERRLRRRVKAAKKDLHNSDD
jgi:sortase A